MRNSSPIIKVGFYEPYPMGLGGNFLTQRLILERLDRQRFHPLVIAPAEGAALDRFRSMGIECLVIPPPGALGRYGGALLRAGILGRMTSSLNLLRYNLRLARFFRERGVGVVYANGVRAQLCAGLAARLAGVPTLLYIKGELANPLLDHLSLLLASRVLFFCPQNRDDRYPLLLRWCRRKIGILRIGLDPATIAAAEQGSHAALREELKLDPACLNTVILAQLYPPKGQHLALAALARLAPEFPKLQLYLVGDPVLDEYRPYQTKLKALVESLGLSGRVHFTGWRKDALEIAGLMDIVIHPSLAEGFGRAVLESMALGRPVVASAVGGLREAIQDGRNGFLVSPGDVGGLTQRWRELLSSPALRQRLGDEARRTVFIDYLIDDKVQQLTKIWAQLAAGRESSCVA